MSLELPLPRSHGRGKWLSPEECIAINLLWRKGNSPIILARAFGVSHRAAYYRAISETYPSGTGVNTARLVNEYIDRMGVDAAWEKYVTARMIRAVARENKIKADARSALLAKKRAA